MGGARPPMGSPTNRFRPGSSASTAAYVTQGGGWSLPGGLDRASARVAAKVFLQRAVIAVRAILGCRSARGLAVCAVQHLWEARFSICVFWLVRSSPRVPWTDLVLNEAPAPHRRIRKK